MVHHRQRLTLGFKARDDLARVHAELNYFESDPAADGLFLLSYEDSATTALADFL
jgi:hypothetical protein